MARSFDGSTANYLGNDTAPVTGYPLTVMLKFFPTNFSGTGATQSLFSIANISTFNSYFQILLPNGSGQLRALKRDSSGSATALITGAATLNQWNHACLRAINATTFEIILNADFANAGTNATAITPTSLSGCAIGILRRNTVAEVFLGRIAEVAVYNAILTDGEIAAHHARGLAHTIRPLARQADWPLWGVGSPEPDYSGAGRHMVINGTVPHAHHAPVQPWFRPRSPVRSAAAAAGAVVTSVDTDDIVDDLQQNVVIAATGLISPNLAEIGDDPVYASATKVTLDKQAEDAGTVTAHMQQITTGTPISELLSTRPLYVFVTPDGGAPSAAHPITLNDSDPYLGALDGQLSVMQGLTPGTKPADLIGHWHFDDPSGTTLEDRWRGHNGSLVGAPSLGQAALPPSSARSSIRFAAGQRADVAHHADFAQAEGGFFTWWRPNSLANASYVWNKSAATPGNHDVEHYFDADGSITFRVHDGTQWRSVSTAPGYVVPNQDVHSGVIWDNTGWTLYVDGKAVGSKITQHTAGLVSNSRAWRFGAAPA